MLRHALLLALAAFALACGPAFTINEPPGFVEIDNDYDNYDYRGTTADGLVISVREIAHDPKGEPAFWLKAVKNAMRDRGGYALLDEVAVTSADGVRGTELRFGHDEEGDKPHLYYVAVFVTDSHIVLFEAGGDKKLMTEGAAKIKAALGRLSVN